MWLISADPSKGKGGGGALSFTVAARPPRCPMPITKGRGERIGLSEGGLAAPTPSDGAASGVCGRSSVLGPQISTTIREAIKNVLQLLLLEVEGDGVGKK